MRNSLFPLRMSANLIGFLFVLFAVLSCKDKTPYTPATEIPEAVMTYVLGYTSGIIGAGDPVRVRFTGNVVTEEQVGGDAGDILTFSPSAKGRAWWEDRFTLRFDPDPNWGKGQGYLVKVALDDVFDNLPEEARSFEFNFLVKNDQLWVDVFGLEIRGEGQEAELPGTVSGISQTDQDGLEKLLVARQDGQSLPIVWEQQDGGQHAFVVQKVTIKPAPSKLTLEWDGAPLQIKSKGSQEIDVPAIAEFRLLSVHQSPAQPGLLTVFFSQPLRSDQNLQGLLALQPEEGSIQTDLHMDVLDNKVRIYPPEWMQGKMTLMVYPGLRSITDRTLDRSISWDIEISVPKPAVRLLTQGAVIPSSEAGWLLPFEAVSLQAVEVEIFKVFDNNVLQFLQTSTLEGVDNNYEMNRVGRVISQQMVPLKGLDPDASPYSWNRYALDLGKLFTADEQAIYQVRIGFRPSYALLNCKRPKEDKTKTQLTMPVRSSGGGINSIWDNFYGIEGYYEGWNWAHRENPCFPAFYNRENFVATNVLASNFGLTAKMGEPGTDGQVHLFVAAADLRTSDAIAGAEVSVYDYQQQVIGSAKTGDDGTATFYATGQPTFLVAKKEGSSGILRLMDGEALSMSRFNISGSVVQKGMKGYIYGERGVWRPGDELFLNFVLDDPGKSLPESYPVAFELYDPRGQLQHSAIMTQNIESIYPIQVRTSEGAPTGNWRAVVKAGGAVFEKILKVETVKPNRLRIALKFSEGKETLSIADEPVPVDVSVNWLHGAPGAGLRTVVEAEMKPVKTSFENFGDFVFDDPAREIYSEPLVVFDGTTDKTGMARFQKNFYNRQNPAPGAMSLSVSTRAFERGGDFSINNTRLTYHPYEAYAGVSIPENKYGEKRLDLGKNGRIRFSVASKDGKPLSGRNLTVGLYRVEWRWWWDSDHSNISQFSSANHYNALQTAKLTTDGKGMASWETKVDDWGRYLVRVCDATTGHCSGDFFYAGYPWYDDGSNLLARQAAAMMTFKTDKQEYESGQDIKVIVPAGDKGRVLITLEKGGKVLQSLWKDAAKGENMYRFKATDEMVPTVYVYASLVQPHEQVQNDLPMRMYGVLAVDIKNPKTILEPVVALPDELKPEQEFSVEVSEKAGKPMAYTIAIVDEGLLGLTNFKTPNPHDAFYAREALGVHTWDIYDQVLGAYRGNIQRILAVGGDEEAAPTERKNANRFKPVVLHAGPFFLKSGKKKHTFTMPNYVGSVRVMVVAANRKGACGSAEKVVPVRKPLMVLTTLPRVLSPGERLSLPVTVFAMDKKVKQATISVAEESGLVGISGEKARTLNFSAPGDKMIYFDLVVNEGVGIAKFTVSGSGGGERASEVIKIDVRNPNPVVTNSYPAVVAPGQSWAQDFEPPGMRGTNQAILEVSVIPPLNLGQRLNFLIRYPHGCVEQTTSAAFPQLYVDKLMKLNNDQKLRTQQNVTAAINKLKNFQQSGGGFAYWPGGGYYNNWSTCYVGHFLLEAKNAGYAVPQTMIDRFVNFQRKEAKMWSPSREEDARDAYAYLVQAYRLYTIALAGKPDASAMNRLRGYQNLPFEARWRLAAAYALSGKKETGAELVKGASMNVEPYTELSFSYGSELRDEAMILEALIQLGDKIRAADLAMSVARSLGEERWYSTQTTAFALLAVAKYLGQYPPSESFSFTYAFGTGKRADAGSNMATLQIEVPVDRGDNRRVALTNSSEMPVYARLILSGQPAVTTEVAAVANNLTIAMSYHLLDGTKIDPANLTQGTDFVAEVLVHNPGTLGRNYYEVALEQLFPAGWEIINSRMFDTGGFSNTATADYTDVRDDRVYTYFHLNRWERKVFRIRLNAAYEGRFFLPPTSCYTMYDDRITARQPGTWVTVQPAGGEL